MERSLANERSFTKCAVIHCSRSSTLQHTYNINHRPLNGTDQNPYLGLIIHKSMSWKPHINAVVHKASINAVVHKASINAIVHKASINAVVHKESINAVHKASRTLTLSSGIFILVQKKLKKQPI